MSDLLSAASLFLAVLGLLYSAWYAEMKQMLEIQAPEDRRDRGSVISKVKVAYHRRALPLAVGAATVSVILLPDLVRLFSSSLQTYLGHGLSAIKSYDAVQTLFCAIWFMTFAFAGHAASFAKDLKTKFGELNES